MRSKTLLKWRLLETIKMSDMREKSSSTIFLILMKNMNMNYETTLPTTYLHWHLGGLSPISTWPILKM